jgi:hypothetical protein
VRGWGVRLIILLPFIFPPLLRLDRAEGLLYPHIHSELSLELFSPAVWVAVEPLDEFPPGAGVPPVRLPVPQPEEESVLALLSTKRLPHFFQLLGSEVAPEELYKLLLHLRPPPSLLSQSSSPPDNSVYLLLVIMIIIVYILFG